ncbi:MAG TPA: alpha/beta hydrolase [Actinomycetota bacterium]
MDTVISKDGTPIAYDRVGEGPALVVVDGAFAHPAINPTTGQLGALLSPAFTVVSYARRGRGESGDTKPFAKQREIEDLGAVVEAVGGTAFVLGGSSGSFLVLDAAAAGLPIRRLAVYEPPIIVDDSRPPLPADYVEHLDRLTAEGRIGDAVAYFMTAAMGMPEPMVDGMRQGPFWPELEKVAPTLAYDGTFVAETMSGRPLDPARWTGIEAPVLVIDGGASESFMHTGADALAAVLEHAERRTLEGQTHDVAADVLAPVLAEFFGPAGR